MTTVKVRSDWPVTEWHGLYNGNWKGLIVPDAFAHPAKFARKLIEQIYRHCLGEGWLRAGDLVLDPFGGVGLGGLDAMLNGLHHVSVELEQRFVDLARGYDCPGFTRENWRRYYGRLSRLNYDRLHLCPDCVRAFEPEPQQVTEPKNKHGKTRRKKGAASGSAPLFAELRKHPRSIPHTEPHHFVGNTDLWQAQLSAVKNGWGTAHVIQGDSRRLIEVLRENGFALRDLATISSPPYNLPMSQDHRGTRGGIRGSTPIEDYAFARYGNTPGQLEGLPMTDDSLRLAISSPPYSDGCAHNGGDDDPGHLSGGQYRGVGMTDHIKNTPYTKDGDTDGQLGAMPVGDFQLAVGSPPYAATLNSGSNGIDWNKAGRPDRTMPSPKRVSPGNDDTGLSYGAADGQLGQMREGDFGLAVSSPPYVSGGHHADQTGAWGGQAEPGEWGQQAQRTTRELAGYGRTQGQLGQMEADGFEAAIGSPPWAGVGVQEHEGQTDALKDGGLIGGGDGFLSKEYGYTPGQLGAMGAKDFDASIASPPYEGSLDRSAGEAPSRLAGIKANPVDYTMSADNMGNTNGQDFWSASRMVVDQVYATLTPGGHAVWVVKDFVRDGKMVPFSQQWRMLCEASGFVMEHEHHAMLTERGAAQMKTDGGQSQNTVKRISFFRRLSEDRASAKTFWENVPRQEKYRCLIFAHAKLWAAYKERRGKRRGFKYARPNRSRIVAAAQMQAWKDADKPEVESQTTIDFEVVLCMSKPERGNIG